MRLSSSSSATVGGDVLEQAFASLASLCQLVKVDCVVGVIRMAQRVHVPAFTFAMASLLLDCDAAPVTRTNYEHHIQLGVLILAQVMDRLTSRHQDLPMYPLANEVLCRCMSYAKLDVLELHQLLPVIRIGSSMYQCLDCPRYFHQHKRALTEWIVQDTTRASASEGGGGDANNRRESARRSRRESYSVFDETMAEVATTTEARPKGQHNNNYTSTSVDLVINCLSVLLEIVVLRESSGAEESVMAGRFLRYLDGDFAAMDMDELKKGFTQTVNQLFQAKMLRELHLIFHEMLKAQQRLGLSIINGQYSLAVTRKLLGQMLGQEKADVQGKWARFYEIC